MGANGFKGQAHFMRAADIFDGSWPSNHIENATTNLTSSRQPTATVQNFSSSFSVGEHRTDGVWDMLVYVADTVVDCETFSFALLTITGKDVQTPTMSRPFASCAKAGPS